MSDTTKKRKVMIVDDDKFLLEMYAMKFKKSDFEVDTVLSGVSLIEKLEQGTVCDVVLLDMIMPGKSGIETLQEIRTKKLAPDVTFIVLSNQNQESDISKSKELGVAGYIVKASTVPSEVVRIVTEILDNPPAGGSKK
jgi:CheY-like chemotaxis protein